MSLGEKLQETLDQQRRAEERRWREQARLREMQEQRDAHKHESFVEQLKTDIALAIEAGQNPSVKVTDYGRQRWIDNAEMGAAQCQWVWNNFIGYMKDENLRVLVNEEHDGMGMHSWYTITVVPIKK